MTGYGEAVAENESFKVKAAAKAVNQRYLDIALLRTRRRQGRHRSRRRCARR